MLLIRSFNNLNTNEKHFVFTIMMKRLRERHDDSRTFDFITDLDNARVVVKNFKVTQTHTYTRGNDGSFPYTGYIVGQCAKVETYEYDGLPPRQEGALSLILRKEDVLVVPGAASQELSVRNLALKETFGTCQFVAKISRSKKCLQIVSGFDWLPDLVSDESDEENTCEPGVTSTLLNKRDSRILNNDSDSDSIASLSSSNSSFFVISKKKR